MARMSKKAMTEFLKKHFRYDTMNSWNGSTSFAADVKIHHSWVPRELQDKAYEMLEMREPFQEIEDEFWMFATRYNYDYQMGFNGRSGGYIVLYRGYRERNDYKSRCKDCGQLNYEEVGGKRYPNSPPHTTCGRCGSKNIAPYEGYNTGVYAGQSIELDEDADYDSVKQMYDLVKDFDATVERCKEIFLGYCRDCEVVEEEVMVPETVKVLKCTAAA